MDMDIKKSHGGARPGAGRPKGDSKMVSFRLPGDMASRLDAKPNKTDFIRRSLRRALDAESSLASVGSIVPATAVKTYSLPFLTRVSWRASRSRLTATSAPRTLTCSGCSVRTRRRHILCG